MSPNDRPAAVATLTLAEYDAEYEHQVRAILVGDFHLGDADLDDVLADVLVKVWRALDGGWQPDARGPMPWLAAVGRNATIDLLRRRQTQRRWLADGAIDDLHWLADPAPGPAAAAERAETAAAVRAAVAALPPRARQAVALQHFADLDQRTIARRLGCARPTVAGNVRHGRKLLRSMLADVA